jgi:hypothetical protein
MFFVKNSVIDRIPTYWEDGLPQADVPLTSDPVAGEPDAGIVAG